MIERCGPAVLALFLCAAAPPALAAGGKGQGAIVVRDGAPVYATPKSDKIVWTMRRGDAVAGLTDRASGRPVWIFDETRGRVQVVCLKKGGQGMERRGWMAPADLVRFTYDGSCGHEASPFVTAGGFSRRWNACFQEARDAKLEQLRATWSQKASPADKPPVAVPADEDD